MNRSMAKNRSALSNGSVLTREQIRALLQVKPPLVENMIDAETQLQPNGVDLTVRRLEQLTSEGYVDFSNAERTLSKTRPLGFVDDRVFLRPGAYKAIYNEVVHLPKDVMAFGAPRTSLIRCGVTLTTGFWDAGYGGRSESLLVVHNEHGFVVMRSARLLQLVFVKLADVPESGYCGIYQSENIDQ
ncbi:MAG: deoxyuridine 5'-triphosphate nucleotidohydrolase [Candidatus Methanospirareceae archaeon]